MPFGEPRRVHEAVPGGRGLVFAGEAAERVRRRAPRRHGTQVGGAHRARARCGPPWARDLARGERRRRSQAAVGESTGLVLQHRALEYVARAAGAGDEAELTTGLARRVDDRVPGPELRAVDERPAGDLARVDLARVSDDGVRAQAPVHVEGPFRRSVAGALALAARRGSSHQALAVPIARHQTGEPAEGDAARTAGGATAPLRSSAARAGSRVARTPGPHRDRATRRGGARRGSPAAGASAAARRTARHGPPRAGEPPPPPPPPP